MPQFKSQANCTFCFPEKQATFTLNLGCGEWIRTTDFQVMSLAS